MPHDSDFPRTRSGSPGRFHLLAGLPTPAVSDAIDRLRNEVSISTFDEFIGASAGARGSCAEPAILLPSHLETSLLVEDWQGCGYLSGRFGEGARIGNVVTLIDADFLTDQLRSSDSISTYGWGRTARDGRSVADIVVGQIESATHHIVVGRSGVSPSLRRLLRLLNPTAARCGFDDVTPAGLRRFVASPGAPEGCGGAVSDATVVPPWLELLRGDEALAPYEGRFLYRRSLPFDPERFQEWLSHPPPGLVRGKGNVWLGHERARAFGYSCAGSVHRVFTAGSWWAERRDGAWPTCDAQRRRLLDRWHPRFGDRRQEIAFLGLDVDAQAVRASLDDCLLTEAEALESLSDVPLGDAEEKRPSAAVELH